MEISGEALDTALLDNDGQMATQGSITLTVRRVLIMVADTAILGRPPEDTMKAAALVKRIASANGSLHLKSEEVASILKQGSGMMPPSVFEQFHNILEPPPAAPEEGEDP